MPFIQGFAGVGVTAGNVPDPPSGLAGNTAAVGIDLSWNANDEEDNVLYYKLYRAEGLDQVFASTEFVANITGTSTSDIDLLASTSYTYFLVAHNTYGDSDESEPINAISGAVQLPGGGGSATFGVLPLVTGEVPPVLMYSDDGNLLYIEV